VTILGLDAAVRERSNTSGGASAAAEMKMKEIGWIGTIQK
jgi:hypothetical protein